MSTISVDYDVLNQKGSPAWFSDTFANIPTFGYKGRMFISIDTFAFYRDTGTGWDLIGGPGIGTLTGSGATGQVSFFNGTQVLTGNNNLFWDNTNSRLGINTATPGAPLDIHGTGTQLQLNGTAANNSYLVFQNSGASKWRIGNLYNAGVNTFEIYNSATSSYALTIASATNNVVLQGSLTTNGSITTLSTLSNGTFSYTLPSATGTLALTSNLSAYLPLAGGTLTGALIGTSALFSGNLEAGRIGGAVTIGDLFVDSANNSVYVGRQSSTSGDNSKFYVRNRLNTLTALSVDPGGNGSVDVVGTFSTTRGANLATSTGNVGIGNTGLASQRVRITGETNDSSTYNLVSVSSTGVDLFNVRNDGLFSTGLATNSPYNYNVTFSPRSAGLDAGGGFGYIVSTKESKGNIKTLNNIDYINILNPVSFNYRKKNIDNTEFIDDVFDDVYYGFIADEVEKINKDLVFYDILPDGSKKLAGVHYNSVIAILTKAIQELNNKLIKNNIN